MHSVLSAGFRLPEIRYIAERSKLNNSTWSYIFNMDQPIYSCLCPWHCSDIPYVFRNIELVDYPNGSPDAEKVQEAVFESVMAFARNGSASSVFSQMASTSPILGLFRPPALWAFQSSMALSVSFKPIWIIAMSP